MAAVTNGRRYGGLKYHKFILQLRSLAWVYLGQHQGISRAVFLLEALGENPYSYLFQLLEVAHIPWLMAPSVFRASSIATSDLFLLSRLSCLLLLRTL